MAPWQARKERERERLLYCACFCSGHERKHTAARDYQVAAIDIKNFFLCVYIRYISSNIFLIVYSKQINEHLLVLYSFFLFSFLVASRNHPPTIHPYFGFVLALMRANLFLLPICMCSRKRKNVCLPAAMEGNSSEADLARRDCK